MIQIIPIVVLQLLCGKGGIGFFICVVVGGMEPVPILIVEAWIWMPEKRTIPRQRQKITLAYLGLYRVTEIVFPDREIL